VYNWLKRCFSLYVHNRVFYTIRPVNTISQIVGGYVTNIAHNYPAASVIEYDSRSFHLKCSCSLHEFCYITSNIDFPYRGIFYLIAFH
jgi:hypothetical protein